MSYKMFEILMLASWLTFIQKLEQIETEGNYNCIGDCGRAYGGLQIHKEVIEDVNAIYKEKYVHDDAFDKEKARIICIRYLTYWTYRYTCETGNPATDEVKARIWNGGPLGYLKDSTIKYAQKLKELEK